MPTILKSVHVQRPAAAMFALVDDVERYPEFLPWCSKTVVHERTAEVTRASLDIDHHGLIVFKDRLGAARKLLTYYRYPKPAREKRSDAWDSGVLRQLFSVLPAAISSTAGRMVYKHLG